VKDLFLALWDALRAWRVRLGRGNKGERGPEFRARVPASGAGRAVFDKPRIAGSMRPPDLPGRTKLGVEGLLIRSGYLHRTSLWRLFKPMPTWNLTQSAVSGTTAACSGPDHWLHGHGSTSPRPAPRAGVRARAVVVPGLRRGAARLGGAQRGRRGRSAAGRVARPRPGPIRQPTVSPRGRPPVLRATAGRSAGWRRPWQPGPHRCGRRPRGRCRPPRGWPSCP